MPRRTIPRRTSPDAAKTAAPDQASFNLPPGELRLHPDFPSQLLGNARNLSVYLPPGYEDDPFRRYPVLYLHDGQNLFDPSTAAFGVAWDAHTTATRLIHAGRIPPLIMVGLWNTPERLDEYTFTRDPVRQVGGRGELYGRFLVEEVKPFIDRTYRTIPGRDTSGVAGSSLGGLVSLGIARAHRDHFGLCGVISPALWWARSRILRELEQDGVWLPEVRFWLDMGTREGGDRWTQRSGVERTRKLAELFDARGLSRGRDYYYVEVKGGQHNESAWAARFDRVLLFLFGGRPSCRP